MARDTQPGTVLSMARDRQRRRAHREDGISAPVTEGTFFGTLRSEFDEPPMLPEELDALFARFLNLRHRYYNYELSGEEFGTELSRLVYTDASGAQWTVGASSSRWYRRRPGGVWMLTPPDLAIIQ